MPLAAIFTNFYYWNDNNVLREKLKHSAQNIDFSEIFAAVGKVLPPELDCTENAHPLRKRATIVQWMENICTIVWWMKDLQQLIKSYHMKNSKHIKIREYCLTF